MAARNMGSARRRCVQSKCKYATIGTDGKCPRCSGKVFKWEVRLTDPATRDQVSGWGLTKGEAQVAAQRNVEKRHPETAAARDVAVISVAEAMAEWLAWRFREGKLEPQSHDNYTTQSNWMLGHIGGVLVSKLDTSHVTAMWGEERTHGHSTKRDRSPRAQASIRQAASILRNLLEWARTKGYTAKDPEVVVPCEATGNKRRDALSVALVQQYVELLKGHQWEALWVLPMLSMFRWGELAALKWSGVAKTEHGKTTVTVRKALSRIPKKTAETWGVEPVRRKDPKTPAGFRLVLLPDQAAEALNRHRAAQQDDYAARGWQWTEDVLVFQEPNGKPIHAATSRDRWYRWQRAQGVTRENRVTLHGLRRTSATMELGAGMPIVTSKRAGHMKLETTAGYQVVDASHQVPVVAHIERTVRGETTDDELSRLRSELGTMRAENDRLRQENEALRDALAEPAAVAA